MIDTEELYERMTAHVMAISAVMEIPMSISWNEYHLLNKKLHTINSPQAKIFEIHRGFFSIKVVISSNETYASISTREKAFFAKTNDEAEEIILNFLSQQVELYVQQTTK